MNNLLFHEIYRHIKWRIIFKKLKQTKLLILDVDGVLTDGGLFIDSNGEIIKKFDVKDGLGIKLLQEIGIEIVFMSGGIGGSTEERAKQLGIKSCLVGVKDKYRALSNLQQQKRVTKSNTIYIGDDINDLVVKPLVNLLFAPSDASKSILRKVDMVLSNRGGSGAVRELAEKILISKGKWSDISENGWTEIENI